MSEEVQLATPDFGFPSVPNTPPKAFYPSFLNFYTSKSPKAEEAKAAIPRIKEGDPYVSGGVLDEPVAWNSESRLILVDWYFYSCRRDQTDYKEVEVGAFGNRDLQDAVMVSGFVVDIEGSQVIPIVSTLRTTKCDLALGISQAVEATTKPDWAKGNSVKEMLLKAPAPLRVCADIVLQPKKNYVVAKAACTPSPLNVVKAVGDYCKANPEHVALMKTLMADGKAAKEALRK